MIFFPFDKGLLIFEGVYEQRAVCCLNFKKPILVFYYIFFDRVEYSEIDMSCAKYFLDHLYLSFVYLRF